MLFTPVMGGQKTLSVTSTSGSVDVGTTGRVLMFSNLGTNKCFVRWLTTAPTAVTTDMVILPSSTVYVARNTEHRYVAAVCSATETATLYITPGDCTL